jgi:hypothetical protein
VTAPFGRGSVSSDKHEAPILSRDGRKPYFYFTFLLVATFVSAQPRAAIQGTVLRDDTGVPLAGAEVRLKSRKAPAGTAETRTVTDAGGRFTFAGRAADVYILRIDIAGYPTYSTQFSFAVNPVRYTGVEGKLDELVVRIAPVASISGRVTDAAGKSMSGATVRAVRSGFTRTGRELFTASSTRTDATGEYRLDGLPVGKYYVQARSAEMAMNRAAPVTYFPSTVDFAKATTVDAVAGKDAVKTDIRLVSSSGVTVSGRAMGRGSPPLVFLVRRGAGKEEYGTGVIKPDGTFEIANVPPGAYTLKSPNGSLRIDVGPTKLNGLTIPEAPIFDLKGSIRVEGADTPKAAGLKLVLVPDEGNAALGVVNSDGSFVFRNVTSVSYRVKLAIRQSFYLAGAKFGGKDALDSPIDLTRAKSSPGELALTVNAAGGRVDGRALNERGKPLGVAQVVLVPESVTDRKRPSLYRVIPTEPSGAFSLTGVAPGKYKAFAWRNVDVDAWENPEFLAPYEGRGKTITVAPGSTQAIDLLVIR